MSALDRRRVLTITAFTLADSVALSVLGVLALPALGWISRTASILGVG